MSMKDPTRQQLEDSVRSLLPRAHVIPVRIREAKPTTASAGLGGLVTGFVWGWLRGRRSRRK
ncbi:MAG: hypothetical protein PXZ08_04210 [Actinomycetota bacterium]|nr:hypothetical protein [Actinomycetota bacterium]